MERELSWLGRTWIATVVLGSFSITWGSDGSRHLIHPIGVITIPFLLTAVHWVARAMTGRAEAAMRRTLRIAVLSTVGGTVLELWFGVQVVGLFMGVGLLFFSAAMLLWVVDQGLPETLQAQWRRAVAWSRLISVLTLVGFVAFAIHGVTTGQWGDWEVSGAVAGVAVVGTAVAFVGALLSVARSTHYTTEVLGLWSKQAPPV
jgi:hypothetical protein